MQGAQPKTKSIAGAGPIEFDRDSFGYPLHVDFGNFQLTCKGLDGGTYKVDALFPDGIWREVAAAGKTEAQFVHLDDKFHVLKLRVTYANLGGAAAAMATLSATGRTYRYTG